MAEWVNVEPVDELGVVLNTTPLISRDHPLGATLTIETATKKPRYYLTRQLLEGLSLQIDFELQQNPLPGAVSRSSTESPYELKRRTLPRVRAEAGAVVVRLELSSLRYPSEKLDIEVLFAADIAATLGFELLDKANRLT